MVETHGVGNDSDHDLFLFYSRKRDVLKKDLASLDELISSYEKTCELLEELPNKLRHPVMIPLGSQAFLKAHLIHTNQCLMHFGESLFALRLNHRARESLHLKCLETQKAKMECSDELQQVESTIQSLQQVSEEWFGEAKMIKRADGLVEIMEPLSMDDEKTTTPSHRKSSPEANVSHHNAVHSSIIERETPKVTQAPVSGVKTRVSKFKQLRQDAAKNNQME